MPKEFLAARHVEKDFDCTVIGDIFIDLIVHVSGNRTKFFYGGTSYCDFAKAELGGSGNVAVGLSLLGGKASFIGKAGQDFFGRLYIRNLKKNKVIPQVFFDKCSPTGLVLVFVDNRKERSFLVFRGANDKLSTRDIEKSADLIKKSKYVYISGYSLINEPQQSAILQGIETSRKYNAKIVFDPGAHNLIRSKPQLFAKILDLCDVFSPNLDEASATTNATNIGDIVNKLKGKVPLTTLKCGENGCILISENNTVKVPGVKVRCMDPTGAGDAFTAALIYGLTHELPLEATGQLANWFAAQVVKHPGPRSFPTKSRIDYFLRLSVKWSSHSYEL
jgi:sugar/nucleoside kinase (ribokinase family)